MTRTPKKAGRIIVAGAAAAALFALGYVGTTWSRYGKGKRKAPPDPIIDRYMPSYEVAETHETKIEAPAEVAFRAAEEVDLQQSALVRAIFGGREMLMRSRLPVKRKPGSFLGEVLSLGWRVLHHEPGRYLLIGAVTQPWKADVHFRGLSPEEFPTFAEPGFAKIVVSIVAEPHGSTDSVFRTETRVSTTDDDSRSRFRRYWSFVCPGVQLIRREMLRLVRHEAHRRARVTGSRAGLVAEHR